MVCSCRSGRPPTNGYCFRVRAGAAEWAFREASPVGIQGIPIGVTPEPAGLTFVPDDSPLWRIHRPLGGRG